ncbi:hypothetical protein [Tsuneonella troitsensis]|uniref:hypothetical protein n=1 Tax=Tsuneonella troitsensis TaxID=292222 RepID=UPI0013DE7717|nr:hypothetical protein [Tsuneonella troitsensis]
MVVAMGFCQELGSSRSTAVKIFEYTGSPFQITALRVGVRSTQERPPAPCYIQNHAEMLFRNEGKISSGSGTAGVCLVRQY